MSISMKRVISILMSVVMVISLTATMPSSAADFTNSSILTAIPVSFGKNYTISYAGDMSYQADYYVKVTVPSRGYITINCERPVVDQQFEDMNLYVYDTRGTEIAKQTTNIQASKNLTLKLALNKGTYYINIVNDFLNFSDVAFTSSFNIAFTANNYCEIEPNNGVVTATSMTYGKTYTGFVEPDSSYYDYYKFVVPSARKVRITIGNYASLKNTATGSTYFDLFKSTDTSEYSLEYYNGGYVYKSPVYEFNTAHKTVNITNSGSGYIDKYLTAGTYYFKVSSFHDFNDAYTVNISNMPTTSAAKTTKKSSKPAQVKKLKLKKGGKKTAKVSWSKVKGAKGYQVQWATNKKFKKAKKKFTKKKTITLKKLKKNKYYVRVRAYKVVKGKKVYGKYSKILKLTRITIRI